jgi:hypothetical protein
MNIYYNTTTFHNFVDHYQKILSCQHIPTFRVRSLRVDVQYMYENLARLCMYQ